MCPITTVARRGLRPYIFELFKSWEVRICLYAVGDLPEILCSTPNALEATPLTMVDVTRAITQAEGGVDD